MEKRIYKKIEELNENEKIFLVHKIFNAWIEGKILNNGILFLPSDLKIYNEVDISKTYLICSKLNQSDLVNDIMNDFLNLEFYKKLDVMIYLFEEINEQVIAPNKITDNYSFKDLSDDIIKYKLNN